MYKTHHRGITEILFYNVLGIEHASLADSGKKSASDSFLALRTSLLVCILGSGQTWRSFFSASGYVSQCKEGRKTDYGMHQDQLSADAFILNFLCFQQDII